MDRVSEKCKGLLHPARPVLENDALEVLETDVRKHLLGLCVDGDGRGVQAGVLRHPVVPLLALLLLELEGDTADRALLNAPHEVGDVASDLVAHALRRDRRDLVADALVVLEVEAELTVEALDDQPGSALRRLRPDATHVWKGQAGQSLSIFQMVCLE